MIVLLLLFLERLIAMRQLGVTYTLNSDDLSYVNSGITFIKTGNITMHGVLTAQIMPGMPVFIGIISLFFGEGELLWFALKLIWITMGVWSAYFIYKSVSLFAPKCCGIIASLLLFTPDFVWMDNVILTETPFMLLLTAMIYFTFMMAKTVKYKYFWLCLISYFLALMFKANIGIYPVFALIYLLLKKYNVKVLFKQALILVCVLCCFFIPWTIRNYIHFDAFIPLTYGAGNPILLGTYQGAGCPEDSSLDYKTNVDDVAKEVFKEYYDTDNTIKEPFLERYISLEKDGIKAKYRISEWFKSNPFSFLKSYLWSKPKYMITSAFYWKDIFGVSRQAFKYLRTVGFIIVVFAFISAFFMKKRREEMSFLALLYIGNIYIYALTFAFERYSQPLLPIRFIAFGIGLALFIELVPKLYKSVKTNQTEC
ncbi:MAG: glycosyltransferase family 39 protein [Clostridiaceae bacterium]|nr:glycosyltransferase family 39 protein [Clostridiaceae bacterium]